MSEKKPEAPPAAAEPKPAAPPETPTPPAEKKAFSGRGGWVPPAKKPTGRPPGRPKKERAETPPAAKTADAPKEKKPETPGWQWAAVGVLAVVILTIVRFVVVPPKPQGV